MINGASIFFLPFSLWLLRYLSGLIQGDRFQQDVRVCRCHLVPMTRNSIEVSVDRKGKKRKENITQFHDAFHIWQTRKPNEHNLWDFLGYPKLRSVQFMSLLSKELIVCLDKSSRTPVSSSWGISVDFTMIRLRSGRKLQGELKPFTSRRIGTKERSPGGFARHFAKKKKRRRKKEAWKELKLFVLPVLRCFGSRLERHHLLRCKWL